MKQSNIYLLKKAKEKINKKTSIFKASSGHQNVNYEKSNNSTGRKFYLISLLDKNSKIINRNKFNFKTKPNKNKEIFLTSGIESMNIYDGYKTRFHKGNINIRLNLNNEIINNNFNNYYTTNKNFHKSRSNIGLNDKIKEKDKLITKLQKELLQSQELLNEIQRDKQNELTLTYNTIKKYDRLDKKNNLSLISLLKSPSLLKLNYNNKIRDSVNNDNYNIFNSGLYSFHNRNYKIESSSPKSNYIKSFSSSPNRFLTYNIENLESLKNNFSIKNTLNKKSNNIIKLKNKSSSNIFLKKNGKIPSTSELYLTRQLSYSNYNGKDFNYNNININKEFKDKCQKLIKRAKLLLNKYISLIE